MPILLVRLLPWLVAAIAVGLAEFGWRVPASYPLPFIGIVILVGVGALLIGWRRVTMREIGSKSSMLILTLASLSVAALNVDTPFMRSVVTVLLAGLPLLVLELLFYLAYDHARFPVNGLSRLNVAFVPLAAAAMAYGLSGLLVFVQMGGWVALLVMSALGAACLYVTSHPSATTSQRQRWSVLGGIMGLHVGVLLILLPVGLGTQAAVAAILFAIPTRMRRHAFQPFPPRNLAWAERVGVLVVFLAILLTARWA